MEIRELRREEMGLIWHWVKERCGVDVYPGSFPETSYVAVDSDYGVITAHVSLIVTNTNIGWLEFFVANPKIPKEMRKYYTKPLLEFVEKRANDFGLTRLFCMAPNAKLNSYYKTLGFFQTAKIFTLMKEIPCLLSPSPESQPQGVSSED